MGIAAYNRGSKAISDRIDAETRSAEFDVMDILNDLPKYPDAGKSFGPVQFVAGNNGWWIECPVTGFGFWYSTLHEAVRRWRVTINGFNCGIWQAVPKGGQ
jgi:hypothetical protein